MVSRRAVSADIIIYVVNCRTGKLRFVPVMQRMDCRYVLTERIHIMADITKVDPNFKVSNEVKRDKLAFYDAEEAPFRIYGVKKENGKFRRLPEAVAKSVNEGVYSLHANTAGGRVRFVTDSEFVAIHAEIENIPDFPHMPRTGACGLDLYAAENGVDKYRGSFVPPFYMEGGYESIISLGDNKEKLITINFPLYSDLTKLYVGISEDAVLKEAPDYTYETPVVYYGSSITQGGCAARPGNCYQHILTRKLDCNHINLGFSGSARAEDEMIEWLKNMEMKVFVLDYDHNAPVVEHLRATHEKLFQAVRESQPELPIIIMARPKYDLNEDDTARLEVIKTTYEHAIAAGDRNVYFLDGPTLMADIEDGGTVDNCHPTDSGFASMARAIYPVLKEILEN